jgi:hypothetical protein
MKGTLALAFSAALTVAVALVFAASMANASSISVIWQNSGTSVTTAATSAVVTADIVVSIGAGDTAIGGAGSVFELSADVTGSFSYVSSVQTLLTDWLFLGGPTDGGSGHIENVVAQGDLYGTGGTIAAGGSGVIGTITVLVGETEHRHDRG